MLTGALTLAHCRILSTRERLASGRVNTAMSPRNDDAALLFLARDEAGLQSNEGR